MKYIYLICPFTSLIVCQLVKFLIETIKHKKVDLKRLFGGSGGMPSSHSTFSSSLTMLIGFNYGFDSTIFALALIFMLVTSYDAMGVRNESGKHAKLLNQMINNENSTRLKEEIGHEPLEVFAGLLLGTIVAAIFSLAL